MVDEQLNHDALNEHNRLRELHGCPPLKYDSRLAREAQAWADNLARMKIMKHSICDEYGENLATSQSTGKAELTGARATQNWYNEIHDHNFDKQFQSETGHFTQLIWKNTSKAGFGIQYSNDEHHVFVVGRYEPSGNIYGEFQENVPRPIHGQSTPKSREFSYQHDEQNGPRRTCRDEIVIVRETDRRDNNGSNHITMVDSSKRNWPNGTTPNSNNESTIRAEKKSQRKCAKRCSII
ncbi:unnamed protein product [Schistosoma intercalatum]|nr:unnamed protein product [Schistosoma intercalatum]CAH8433845.1 unnamed protein product [Schistosoma intercalatum]